MVIWPYGHYGPIYGEPVMFSQVDHNMGDIYKQVNHRLNHIWARVWSTCFCMERKPGMAQCAMTSL